MYPVIKTTNTFDLGGQRFLGELRRIKWHVEKSRNDLETNTHVTRHVTSSSRSKDTIPSGKLFPNQHLNVPSAHIQDATRESNSKLTHANFTRRGILEQTAPSCDKKCLVFGEISRIKSPILTFRLLTLFACKVKKQQPEQTLPIDEVKFVYRSKYKFGKGIK